MLYTDWVGNEVNHNCLASFPDQHCVVHSVATVLQLVWVGSSSEFESLRGWHLVWQRLLSSFNYMIHNFEHMFSQTTFDCRANNKQTVVNISYKHHSLRYVILMESTH